MRGAWARGAALLAWLASLVGGAQPADQDPMVQRYQAKMSTAQASFYAWNTRPVTSIQGQWRASFGKKQTSPRQVLLLSYPNSGTTWSKELFEDATGTASLAVYRSEGRQTYRFKQCAIGRCEGFFDERGMTKRAGSPVSAAAKKPMRAELSDVNGTAVRMETVAYVKSHRTPRGVINLMTWEAIVHVVRNPIDNMVANLDFLNKKNKGPMHGRRKVGPRRRLAGNATAPPAPRRRLGSSDKPAPSANQVEFMAGMMKRYVRWHCHAILGSEFVPTQTVLYEDLLENPVPQLKRILDFMGYTSLTPADYERSSKLHPAKYYPPLAPGLPTKWDRVAEPRVWEPLADAFLEEWLPIEAKLRVPRKSRSANFGEICGDMGNGPFAVL